MVDAIDSGLMASAHYENATAGRHRRFQSGMATLAKRGGDAGRRWQASRQRLQALDRAERIERQQAASDPRFGSDAQVTRRHVAHRNAVHAARLDEYARFATPELRQWEAVATRTADDLHHGRRGFAQLAPGELSAAIAHATNLDPQELRPGSPLVLAAQTIVRAARASDLDAALPALNQLYHRVLDGHVGQHLHDGGVISRAPRIVGLHPDSRHPAQTTFAARFTVTAPDGRAGTMLRPLLLDSGHLSLHPDEARGSAVLSVPTHEFVHYTLGLATAILAAQHPQIQAQLDAVPEAQRQQHRALLDLGMALGDKGAERQFEYRPLGNGDIAVTAAGGLHRLVRLPAVEHANEERREQPAPRARGILERLYAGDAVDAADPADPYHKGRLYLGHDGRKARYLGGGKWGAP